MNDIFWLKYESDFNENLHSRIAGMANIHLESDLNFKSLVMKFIIVSFISMTLILGSSLAFGMNSCIGLFTTSVPIPVPGQSKKLSNNGVFLLFTSDGKPKVVRLSSKTADVRFELFASNFIAQAMGVPVVVQDVLPASKTKNLMLQLNLFHPKELELYKKRSAIVLTRYDGIIEASIADWVKGMKGSNYLESMGISDWILLFNRERNDHLMKWMNLSELQKQNLLQFFGPLFPKEIVSKSIEDKVNFLIETLSKFSAEQKLRLTFDYFNQIPLELRQQLADMWALYTTLGIPDPHAGNWRWDQGKVFPVDHAWNRDGGYGWIEGFDGLSHEIRQHPFGSTISSAASDAFLITNMSPSMIQTLSQLTIQSVKAIAVQSGYEEQMTDQKAQRIVRRAQEILSRRRP